MKLSINGCPVTATHPAWLPLRLRIRIERCPDPWTPEQCEIVTDLIREAANEAAGFDVDLTHQALATAVTSLNGSGDREELALRRIRDLLVDALGD